MTRLLVSVRDAAEAQTALDGGADIIDVKEPLHGSLGGARAAVLDEVRTTVGGRAPLSAALGELIDGANLPNIELARFAFAKVGLAGCRRLCDWQIVWRNWAVNLTSSVAPVAVAYADHGAAQAPSAEEVLATAIEHRAPVFLIDTFDKSAGHLLAHCPPSQLRTLSRVAHDAGLQVALAGSLSFDLIGTALEAEPDIIAVRGAVCIGGRNGGVSRILVNRLANRLSIPRQRSAS